jgi:flagellar basal-body rod protein FlgB
VSIGLIAGEVGGVTASSVAYALDGLALRHAAIAANIANANSVGYQPVEVSFESYLADYLAKTNMDTPTGLPTEVLPKPDIKPSQFSLAGREAIEMQAVFLNQNVLQYQALISGLGKYMSTVAVAINEGRK